MKKTKKAISLLMATTLCMSLSVPVFAADPTSEKVTTMPDTADHVHNVYAKIKDNTATVYSVDLTWSSMYFAWQGDKGTWDPDTLTYNEDTKTGKWVAMKGSNDSAGEYTTDGEGYHSVNIENRSNAGVEAKVTTSTEDSTENPSTLNAKLTAPTTENGVSVEESAPGTQVKIGLKSADNAGVTGEGNNKAYSTKVKVGVSDPTVYTTIGDTYAQIGKVYVELSAWDGTAAL